MEFHILIGGYRNSHLHRKVVLNCVLRVRSFVYDFVFVFRNSVLIRYASSLLILLYIILAKLILKNCKLKIIIILLCLRSRWLLGSVNILSLFIYLFFLFALSQFVLVSICL